MPARANLYAFRDRLPSLHTILATSAYRSAEIAPPPDGIPVPAAVLVGGSRIEMTYMAPDELKAHLEELQEYLGTRCHLEDPGLPARLKEACAAITVTLDPGFDVGGACELFVSALAARTNALVLYQDGSVQDPEGRTLAYALRGPEGDEEEAAVPPPPLRFEAPSRDRVAKRALVLATLAWRGGLEGERRADAAVQNQVAGTWVEKQGLYDEMEEDEKALLSAPPRSWSEEDLIDRGWAIEAVGVLAWALRLCELPAHDAKVWPPQLLNSIGFFAPKPVVFAAELRPAQELDALQVRLFAICWRLRRFATAPGPFDFAAFTRQPAFAGFDLSDIPMVENDLAIAGKPISTAPAEAVEFAHSVAVERYRAVTWLVGQYAHWSEAAPRRRPEGSPPPGGAG